MPVGVVTGDLLDGLDAVDHHCHAVTAGDLSAASFEALLSESSLPAPDGCTKADSALGLALRAWCAPVLELPAAAGMDAYVERRAALGAAEVNRRMLSGTASHLLVDTGYRSDELATLDEMAGWSGAAVREVVRLETLAERALEAGGDYADAFASLVDACGDAVGWKSVAAYRCGLAIDWRRPPLRAVEAAAERWRRTGGRLGDPVLIRHGVWTALDDGRPLQLHTGFGDNDLRLPDANPAHLDDLLRLSAEVATPVLLLHCWPWHREAAHLAQVWPHAYMDVGLALPHVGHHADRILAEALEMAPWHKVLYSSDAFGLSELYFLGARAWRSALRAALEPLAAMGFDDAELRRLAALVLSGNARRIYRL